MPPVLYLEGAGSQLAPGDEIDGAVERGGAAMVNIFRALAVLLIIEAAWSIHRHGWVSYDWPARACFAIAFLLVEPKREGERVWTRLRRPRQLLMMILAVGAFVLLLLSIRAGTNL